MAQGFKISFLKSNYVLRSKEISKSNVVDDMMASNEVLYEAGKTPDHTVCLNDVYLVKYEKTW